MTVSVVSGSFSANGFSDAFTVSHRARMILKGPTFGGGTVHLCVADAGGVYYRTGRSWTGVAVEIIDSQSIGGAFKLELAGASGPTLGWEIMARAG